MEYVVGASQGAAKSLIGKLGTLLAQEYALISGVHKDIQYINDEFSSIQAFLSRLERATEAHDEQRLDWFKQVRELSYDTEDCIDNVSHDLDGEPRGRGMLVFFRRISYLVCTLYARHCIAKEIRSLKARAQDVSERRTRYGVENPTISGTLARASTPRDQPEYPRRFMGTKEPVGMEEALKALEPWFSFSQGNPNVAHQLRFLAIDGFGGIGKTTTATTLYHQFGDEFDCKAIVLASQKFHLSTVLRSLIRQFHEHQSGASSSMTLLTGIDGWGEEVLKKKLNAQLKEKRYLVFIDDIWSVSAMENVRDSMPKSQKGGTIMVTTRFKSVSEACRRQQGLIYEQKALLEGNSYNLFHQTISSAGVDLCPATARSINVGIIMKICRGLPLAIVVVAGLVASKLRSEPDSNLNEYLAQVGEYLSEKLGNNLTTEGVTSILDYCYSYLPADLKACLLYMGMFPKGSFIRRKSLIRSWIAEGLVTEKYGKTIEEVAEDCFNELICRNLVRACANSSNGKVKSFQIHDNILQYIVAKSSEENYITVVGGHWDMPFPRYKVRRLSVQKTDLQERAIVEKMKLSHVRSLRIMGSFRALHSTSLKFQILRVLDLESCKDLSSKHLKRICKMLHLTFLSLRRTGIDKIPKNISKLEYLEFLDIRDTGVRMLPSSVERLQRMVHLLAGNKNKGIALTLTAGITKMLALETLCGIDIDIALHKGQSPLGALENLMSLKKLTIYGLRSFTSGDNMLLLSAIEHLSSCSLKFLAIDDDFSGFHDSSLILSEAPPEHLHTLGLCGRLSKLPRWIDRLHNLEKLTLSLTSLTTDTLLVVAELPELFALIFSLQSTKNDPSVLEILHSNTSRSGGKIVVLGGGFRKLKLMRLDAPVLPPLNYLDGAMPELERLELKFRMVEGIYGVENLANLQQVVLTISSKAPEDAKAKASQIKELTRMSREINAPNVIIDEYNESSQE